MKLLPRPKKVEEKEGFYELGFQSVIVIDETICENGITYAVTLRDSLKKSTGIECAFVRGRNKPGDIHLTISRELREQEYCLNVTKDGIMIAGGDGAAVFYGVQTFCQIAAQYGGMIPGVKIEDWPDVMQRGYFFDETRGRVLTLPALKKMVDTISRYKINQFQLYVEHTYLFRGLSEMWRDETPLTAEDILELDEYCRQRHVELIPAMASFGHLYTLLSTRSYGELCERSESWTAPFSFRDRMHRHTLNATDERALTLVKEMIGEYGALFSSDKFNICADETFDLGCEKSKETAEREGTSQMYIRFVNELCTFLTEHGRQPMFFGDIICRNPDYIRRLPENTLCLTWGYDPEQREDECRSMAQAGAKQYLCPGVCGWNKWINSLEDSYRNITKMCAYAQKYHAEGILNTDWGDFGHVNFPAFSVPGMIYGAAFSWNHEEIGFDEMNRQISLLEYGDHSESLTALMAQIEENSLFDWWAANTYYEKKVLDYEPEGGRILPEALEEPAAADRAEQKLRSIIQQIKRTAVHMDGEARPLTEDLDLAGEAVSVWNAVGVFMCAKECGNTAPQEDAFRLAERLERWFMAYKKQWRRLNREGDLHRIAKIVFWYADCIRGRIEI